DALKTVQDSEKGADIVTLGMVSGIISRGGNVGFSIEVEPERGPRLEPLRKAAEKAVAAVPGVLSVTAVLTAPTAPPGGAAVRGAAGLGAPHGRPKQAAKLLTAIGAVVAVASGKCGVAKSTT